MKRIRKKSRPALRAVFLDRDGVVNRKLPPDRYVQSPAEFEFLPRVPEALAIIGGLGYLMIVVTNQRGIARGFMSEADLEAVHAFMSDELTKTGVEIAGVYACPHGDEDDCDCRKPQPGLILAAASHFGVALSSSYMVGDSASDVAAGNRAGTLTVRLSTTEDPEANFTFPSLWEFALHLRDSSSRRIASPDAVPADRERTQ